MALGVPLLLMIALRSDAARSAVPMAVMMLYLGLGIGAGMALLATMAFMLGGVFARLFEDGPATEAEAAELSPSPTARLPRWPSAVIAASWLAGFWIAMFAPHDVLDAVAALRGYESLMATVTNPGGLLGTRSSFPQVTRLYAAVVIWSFPAWLVVWWTWMTRRVGRNRTDMLFKRRLALENRLFLAITVPLWLALLYAFFWLNHGGDTRLVAFGTSRLQLAFFGMVWYLGAAGVLALAAFSLRRLLQPRAGGSPSPGRGPER